MLYFVVMDKEIFYWKLNGEYLVLVENSKNFYGRVVEIENVGLRKK